MTETVTLYHGGKDLEHTYRETINQKNGRWEHGPGLCLTTHYDRARSYAKGGKKVYAVTVEKGTELSEIILPLAVAEEFVKMTVKGSARKEVRDLMASNVSRRQSDGINAESFMNIIINCDAITSSNSGKLKDFLAANGVSYHLTRYGGRDETVMVVMDSRKIRKVKALSATDVPVSDYVLSPEFVPAGA